MKIYKGALHTRQNVQYTNQNSMYLDPQHCFTVYSSVESLCDGDFICYFKNGRKMQKLLILHFCCVLESCSPAMLFIISLLLLWYEGAGPQSEPLSTPGREHELIDLNYITL